MNDRFSPDWNRVRRHLNSLVDTISGNEDLLVEAFVSVSDPDLRVNSTDDVKNALRAIVTSPGTPWVLYDTISALIRRLPQPIREPIIKDMSIETGHLNEQLRLARDGRWQVVWQIAPEGDPEDQYVGLDWYSPPDRVKTPIVPVSIIDYVAASVSLLRGNLILPATAVLLIALEAALWEDLAVRGIPRQTERIKYAPAQWEIKRVSNKLIVTIQGADKDLHGLDAALGVYPPVATFELRKTNTDGNTVSLKLDINDSLVGFFASEREELRETIQEKGLAEAIQRARRADILRTVPLQFDEMLFRLRNNLIHLPSDGNFDPPVPSPGGGILRSLDELKNEPVMVKGVVYLVVELINTLYSGH